MAYIPIGKISELRFMCHKILPLVYDESLSYYETLCKIANILNEAVEGVNQLNDNVEDINDRLVVVEGITADINDRLNNFITQINAEFARLTAEINSEVDAKLAEMDDKVDYKLAEVDATIAELRTYINSQFVILEKQLTDLINSQIAIINEEMADFTDDMKEYVRNAVAAALKEIPDITSVMVNDPTTGKTVDIQTAVNNLCDYASYFALTVDEYNALNLSCNDLMTIALKGTSIPRGMTIREWMTKARLWLWKNPEHHMFNFVTGNKVEYKKDVELNSDMHRIAGCLTASEIGNLGLDINAINALNITAYQWAWRSNRIAFS